MSFRIVSRLPQVADDDDDTDLHIGKEQYLHMYSFVEKPMTSLCVRFVATTSGREQNEFGNVDDRIQIEKTARHTQLQIATRVKIHQRRAVVWQRRQGEASDARAHQGRMRWRTHCVFAYAHCHC